MKTNKDTGGGSSTARVLRGVWNVSNPWNLEVHWRWCGFHLLHQHMRTSSSQR